MKVFLWLARQDRLLTNKARLTRNLSHDSSCPSCGHDVEDTLHVLRDCARAKTVWSVLVENSVQQRFFSLDLADWIDSNISGQLKGNKTVTNWQLTFREDAKKVATCIPFLVPGQESNGYLGGVRTEKWNRGGTSQRREKHLATSDPIRSSSALSLLPYPQVGGIPG